jgi:LmbE family N-acetylglucosaminyl deacetylase
MTNPPDTTSMTTIRIHPDIHSDHNLGWHGFVGRSAFAALLLLTVAAARPCVVDAQIAGPSTGGIAALHQELRMTGHTKRVLMIAAHPDDEDTELLTYLVRNEGAETAYLSLTRGEGGQNLIGPELGDALGLIRTEELLAARRLDGARQYFTRAFDFGFSKTLTETLRFWPRDSILKDVVRIIRRFRPQIVVSIFSGTPRDGHGQHQAAGWAAQEAFRVAGDSTRFPELLRDEGLPPWSPRKLYRSARFDPTGASLALEGGVIDPDVGQSYRQIAMRGRSLHRSQDMGMLQEMGPSTIRLALLEDRTRGGAGGLWAGIDTAPPSSGIEARDEARHRAQAALIRGNLVVDAIAEDPYLVAGSRTRLRLSVWNAGARAVTARLALPAPAGWRLESDCLDRDLAVAPNAVQHCAVRVTVASGTAPTTPYFLAEPRTSALYRWTGPAAVWGEPFDPPVLTAEFAIRGAADGPVTVSRGVVYRFRDQALGEIRRPLSVVPRVDVKLEPAIEVWPLAARAPQRFTVTLQHAVDDTTRGTVRLELPAGWTSPPAAHFVLDRVNELHTVGFDVTPPSGLAPGRYTIRAVAMDDQGRRYEAGVVRVDYPHIRMASYVQPARADVEAASVVLPRAARIAYLRGAADRVPEALAGIGVAVQVLDPSTLGKRNLSEFDAIVVGSRAYETDPALAEQNGRLLEYVRQGGHLVVQYQQQPFFQGGYAPYPMTLASPHDRVTDETAPVRILRPDDPVFAGPNRIGEEDWRGWIQERGLYFAHSWDRRYTPLLSMADPDSPPLEGSLLVASVGKGTYVYTGLSFFRQLPAGVPGAFRLFLNLLDLQSRAAVP